MDTRKVAPEGLPASTDNCPVDTQTGQQPLNDYLRLPRALIKNCHDEMVEFGRRHPDDPDVNGVERSATIRLLAAIVRRPPEVEQAPVTPIDENTQLAELRERLRNAEKLLKECEPLVGTRVRHVYAGSLEWRIGEFLAYRWPRKEGDQ